MDKNQKRLALRIALIMVATLVLLADFTPSTVMAYLALVVGISL